MPQLVSIPTSLGILFFLFLCIELKAQLKQFSIPFLRQVLKMTIQKHLAIKSVIFTTQISESKNNRMKLEFIPVLIFQDSIYLVN